MPRRTGSAGPARTERSGRAVRQASRSWSTTVTQVNAQVATPLRFHFEGCSLSLRTCRLARTSASCRLFTQRQPRSAASHWPLRSRITPGESAASNRGAATSDRFAQPGRAATMSRWLSCLITFSAASDTAAADVIGWPGGPAEQPGLDMCPVTGGTRWSSWERSRRC